MIRKQVYIERRQDTLLKRMAKERRTSETEIICQALDRELAAGFIHVPRFDSEAMSQAFQFMHPRRFRLKLPQNPITGTAKMPMKRARD